VNEMETAHTSSSGFGSSDTNSDCYFRAIVQMANITQAILSSVYSVSTVIPLAVELHSDINDLSQRLSNWMASLPAELDFQAHQSSVRTWTPELYRQRVLLGFQFYSAQILLMRPCFGGEHSTREENLSTGSVSFLQNMAFACVEAAKGKLDLLPDQPNAQFLCENGPWWSSVHHLTQAAAALLLALDSPSFAIQNPAVVAGYVKKAILWLRSMYDGLSQRAYLAALSAFRVVACKLSFDISDL
jgi:hypothetical protein